MRHVVYCEESVLPGTQEVTMLDRIDRISGGVQPLSHRSAPARYGHHRVVVLANRAPLRHERAPDGRIVAHRSAGGLVTALEPLVRACSGTWVGHAAGDADLEAGNACAEPIGGRARPRVRYVALPPHVYRGYYYGFANEGLWPLCHSVGVQPVFRSADFCAYHGANSRFADAVAEESAGSAPIVLVQDYHFALAPSLVRERTPDSTIVTFWHIPWPESRVFRSCPWATELLDGLLGSDVIGFQTEDDCANFLESVDRIVGIDVDPSGRTVQYQRRSIAVRAYPVGVEWRNSIVRTMPPVHECRERVWRDFALPSAAVLGLGIDRLDYTKGLNEKFLAVERLLDSHPDLRGRFSFLQVAEPSRECLREYRNARAHLADTARRVNLRFGTSTYRPIHLLETHHEPVDVYRFYRAADVCYVGSLRDGMNLVAKEFVCARSDHRGVLVLSRCTGAARQLRAALLVNPLAVDSSADALARALVMEPDEQARRMRLLRANVSTFDSEWWASRLLADALTTTRGHGKATTFTSNPQHAWG